MILTRLTGCKLGGVGEAGDLDGPLLGAIDAEFADGSVDAADRTGAHTRFAMWRNLRRFHKTNPLGHMLERGQLGPMQVSAISHRRACGASLEASQSVNLNPPNAG